MCVARPGKPGAEHTTRKIEVNNKDNIAVFEQPLEGDVKFANEDFGEATKGIACNTEKKTMTEVIVALRRLKTDYQG